MTDPSREVKEIAFESFMREIKPARPDFPPTRIIREGKRPKPA